MGAEALRALTNEIGIKTWRGCPMYFKGIPVIPTYHPRYIISQYSDHPIVELDFAKALRFSNHDVIIPKPNILLFPTLEQTIKWIDEYGDAFPQATFDIETIGKHIRCIGLARGSIHSPEAIVIPFIKMANSAPISIKNGILRVTMQTPGATSYWTRDEEVIVLEALAKLFADKTIAKVGQNSIAFDAPVLADEFGFHINNHAMDTMHAWHVLYPEFPKSLNFLCSVKTDYSNYWSNKETNIDESEHHYCAMDSIVTQEASYKIRDELRDDNLWDLYKNHVHRLALALSRSQVYGIGVDKNKIAEYKAMSQLELKKMEVELKELTGDVLNPNSHVQVKRLLYEKLRFPVIYKDKKSTVDETAIRKLQRKYPNEKIFDCILTYRKAKKLIGTYLDAKLDEDGRMRTSWNASGTETGRISSSKTIWKTGLDLQNIPAGRSRGVKNIRDIFVAKEGCIYVKADLSQAETRVVSEILRRLGYYTLAELYEKKNFDIHKWMAAFIYGLETSQITKAQRDVGKLANHSGNYMAGPRVLYNKALKDGILEVDYDFSKRILDIRAKALPGLSAWWKNVEMQIRRTRTITTCLGRRRIFFGRFEDTTFRDAVAFEPQSTVGDVCNMMFWKLDETLDSDCRLVLQVHDEVVVECPEDKVDDVAMKMRKAALIPLWICDDRPLLIPLDISVGKNWKETKEWKSSTT